LLDHLLNAAEARLSWPQVVVTAPNPRAELILVPLLVQQISVPAKGPMWMKAADRKNIEAAS